MRTVKTLLLALAVTFTSVISASTEKDPKATSKLVAVKVAKLLKSPKFQLEEEALTFVKFTLNDDNEIVVLSVDSEEYIIDDFIKSRLNYVKLDVKIESGAKRTFIIPVRIEPTE